MSEYGIYLPVELNRDAELVQLPDPDDDAAFCHFMHEWVQGWFEIVNVRPCLELPRKAVLVCNEEGKLLDMPVNLKATAWYSRPGLHDYIVGPVLLLNTKMTEDGPTCCGWDKETARSLLNGISLFTEVEAMILGTTDRVE